MSDDFISLVCCIVVFWCNIFLGKGSSVIGLCN